MLLLHSYKSLSIFICQFLINPTSRFPTSSRNWPLPGVWKVTKILFKATSLNEEQQPPIYIPNHHSHDQIFLPKVPLRRVLQGRF